MPWLYPKLWVDFEGYCGVSLCTPITSPRIPPKIGGILNPLVVVAKKRVFIKGYLTRKLSKLPTERFFSIFIKSYLNTSILDWRNKKSMKNVCLGVMQYLNFLSLIRKIENLHISETNIFHIFFISSNQNRGSQVNFVRKWKKSLRGKFAQFSS